MPGPVIFGIVSIIISALAAVPPAKFALVPVIVMPVPFTVALWIREFQAVPLTFPDIAPRNWLPGWVNVIVPRSVVLPELTLTFCAAGP